jgi:hypothetical protein
LLRLLVGVEVHFEWTRRGKRWWHDAVTMTRRLSRRFGLQKEINMGQGAIGILEIIWEFFR